MFLRALNKSLELVQSNLQNWVDEVAQSISHLTVHNTVEY